MKKCAKVSKAVCDSEQTAVPFQLTLEMDGFRFQALSRSMGLLFLHDIVQPLRDSLLEDQRMDKLERSLEGFFSD